MLALDVHNNSELSDEDVNSESEDNEGSPLLSDSLIKVRNDEQNTKEFKKRALERNIVDGSDEDEEAIRISAKKPKIYMNQDESDDEWI